MALGGNGMRNLNKIVLTLFLSVSGLCFSAPVSLDFKGASVSEVVHVLVKEVLKRDFVLAPDVAALDKRITVSVRQVEPDSLMPIIEGILKTVEVQIEGRGGILYVEKTKPQMAGAQAQPLMNNLQPDKMSANQPGQVGQGGVMNGNQPTLKVPDEIESYRPRGRGVEFLAAVARAAGASVVENKGKTDRLVFSGTKEAMEKARKILAEVDSPPSSVHVRAVLVEFTDSNTSSRSLSVAFQAISDKIGVTLSAGQQMANALTFKAGNLQAVLSAIDGDSRFKYVAEPTIRVVDGETAKFSVGSDQPTRGSITTDNNGNAQQSIDYKSAGVQINLEPRILVDHVQLKVSQQLSSFALTTTSNIDSPTILKREAQTTVSVKPGELVLLAGMDEQKDSASSSGLSFLPDWLRGTNKEGSRSQLVLMLEVIPEI